MFRHAKNQKGFTLLEMLIVMVILSIVMIAMFQVIDMNYHAMNDELHDQKEKEDLRVFSSFLVQDLIHSEVITIQNEPTFDVLYYTDYKGTERLVKFSHTQGIYEVERGQEILIARAGKFYASKPMVYEENGLIYVNAYAKEVNALLDIAIQPRVRE